MISRGYIFAVCAILSVWATLTGCMSGNDSTVTDVPPKGWNTPAGMVYTNRDTLSERSATLFLRHDNRTLSGRYAVELRAPSGKVASCDTVSVEMSGAYGHSISMPPEISVSMNRKSSYLERIRLTEQGDYTFTVTPLQNTLGVWSVGIDFNETLKNGQR